MITDPPEPTRARSPWFAIAFAALFFGSYYALAGDVGVYLGDEGYLWYGVLRVLAGEVPLRDFQSYDPGRYYWCAAFTPLFGDGLLGMRAAAMAFGALGLACALLVASRFTRSLAELALCGLLLGLWMYPTHKLFEPALACMTIWFGVRLLEQPTPRRHLAAGLFVGLAGFFGRNHALYSAGALGVLALLCLWRERPQGGGRRIGLLALGAFAGHAPMWAMLLFVPGFTRGFVDSCRIFIAHGSQPLPYPWRWPWTVEWSALSGWSLAVEVALALLFLLPPIVLPIGVVRALRLSAEGLRRHAATAATAVVGAIYIHHAGVRSHPQHLAQCVAPVVLLTLDGIASLAGWRRHALHAALALVLGLALLADHPVFSRFNPGEKIQELLEFDVGGETLRLTRAQGSVLQVIERTRELVRPEEPLFIAATWPALYPILGKVAPVEWIAFYFHATPAEQETLRKELEERGVNWVLVDNPKKSERPDFQNLYPLLWESFEQGFERYEMPGAPFALLHRRAPVEAAR